MKKLCLFLMLFCTTIILNAQQPPKVNGPLNQKQILGMTVMLRPAPANTWLFDIMPGKEAPIPPMLNNPVTQLPEGFETPEQAFKAAEWMIKESKKTGHFVPFIPMHIAMEIGLPIHPKPHQPKHKQ